MEGRRSLAYARQPSRTGKGWRGRKKAGLWFPLDAVCHPILTESSKHGPSDGPWVTRQKTILFPSPQISLSLSVKLTFKFALFLSQNKIFSPKTGAGEICVPDINETSLT